MPEDSRHAASLIGRVLRDHTVDEVAQRLQPRTDDPAARVRNSTHVTPDRVQERWSLLAASAEAQAAVLDTISLDGAETYARNIENYIGTVKLPIGLAGPLRINGLFANGDFYVPLATTEAALVASYSRGAQLISEAGGCTVMLLDEGVSRAPAFAFKDLRECGQFVMWALEQSERFRELAESTTSHGKFQDLKFTIEGNHVYLTFEYLTGDASGQNMVTIATQLVLSYILENSPVTPRYSFLEANMSGDKKASAQSFTTVRGKRVTAEVRVPAELVERRLHTTPAMMARYGIMAGLGGVMSGTMGVQGHYANGLAALYIACGQDAACVAESAVGITRWEVTEEGELYASVTMPNIMVGTVGGGTGLPSQRACLEILGLRGPGNAQALAEVAAGVCLAGELSIAAALCSGDFAHAHQRLARGKAEAKAARAAAPDAARS
ncbi:MAG: hydroxymethylglutaryl-CoA reductase [Chloroflexota bacterium]